MFHGTLVSELKGHDVFGFSFSASASVCIFFTNQVLEFLNELIQ